MSATISRPLTGQSKSATPFGVLALIAAIIALVAIGASFAVGLKAAPTAGTVPADVQAALNAQRAEEKAPLFAMNQGILQDRFDENAAAVSIDDRILVHQAELADRNAVAVDGRFIQHQGELADQAAASSLIPSSVSGPRNAAQKGLVGRANADRWAELQNNPYAQGLLSHSVKAPAATLATGGRGFNHR